MQDYQIFLDVAIRTAKAAGEEQMKYFRTANLDIHTKSNAADVVTVADKACENLIKGVIHEQFPLHGIISEESEAENEHNEWRWVVDPLDGTTNFSQGLPVFCVSIALEHYGEPVVGVVYAPYLGELFHSVKGEGAYLNGKRIHCSEKDVLKESVLATGVPYDKFEHKDNNLKEITRIVPMVRGVRRMGSAAIDLSYVAAGFLDGYWELNLNRWDVAAGILIAREAGAVIKPIRLNRRHSIMAANPHIADELLSLCADESC